MKESNMEEIEESNIENIRRLVISSRNREFALRKENYKLRKALVILIKSANKKTLRKVIKELS